MFDYDPETEIRYSWTQPICGSCYQKVENREPIRMRDASPEKCCACGQVTREGIYYRIDPKTVAFPTRRK